MSKPEQKRRVCCFCEQWESGGIESFLYNVLTRIDLDQLQVDIVASSLRNSIFTKPLQKLGIQFFELSGSQRKVAKNHRHFRALMREHHYDVLHLNAFHGLSLSYLQIAKQAGVPIRIAHSHNTALRKSLTRPLKLAVHKWAKEQYTAYATDLWACSQSAAEFLFSRCELDQKDFQFISNGIDTERFRFNPAVRNAMRRELGLDGKFVVGNVGRLCYQKNQAFLLDVFAEVLRQKPESRLLLIGDGEDKSALRKRAQQLGIAKKVIFYGVTDRVEHLLWAMDVFVFPSLFEGLGIAAVEAQAAGLPVVCSEFVPAEVHVTELIRSIPISKGTKDWAKAILKSKQVDREDFYITVENAGFGVEAVAKEIRNKWYKDAQ